MGLPRDLVIKGLLPSPHLEGVCFIYFSKFILYKESERGEFSSETSSESS